MKTLVWLAVLLPCLASAKLIGTLVADKLAILESIGDKFNLGDKFHHDKNKDKDKDHHHHHKENSTFISVACEGETLSLRCRDGRIKIITASYGIVNGFESTCNPNGYRESTCLSNDANAIIKRACNGRSSCELQSDNRELGRSDPCVGRPKYAFAAYACGDFDDSDYPSYPSYPTGGHPSPGYPQGGYPYDPNYPSFPNYNNNPYPNYPGNNNNNYPGNNNNYPGNNNNYPGNNNNYPGNNNNYYNATTESVTVCYDDKAIITCIHKRSIRVVSCQWGASIASCSSSGSSSSSCSNVSCLQTLGDICNRQATCNFRGSSDLNGSSCSGQAANVQYQCV